LVSLVEAVVIADILPFTVQRLKGHPATDAPGSGALKRCTRGYLHGHWLRLLPRNSACMVPRSRCD
jgi:hypothetical protein